MSQELDQIVQRLSTLKQSLNRSSPLRRSPKRASKRSPSRRSPSPKLRRSPQAKLRRSGKSPKRTYTAQERKAIQRLLKSLKKARKTLHKM